MRCTRRRRRNRGAAAAARRHRSTAADPVPAKTPTAAATQTCRNEASGTTGTGGNPGATTSAIDRGRGQSHVSEREIRGRKSDGTCTEAGRTRPSACSDESQSVAKVLPPGPLPVPLPGNRPIRRVCSRIARQRNARSCPLRPPVPNAAVRKYRRSGTLAGANGYRVAIVRCACCNYPKQIAPDEWRTRHCPDMHRAEPHAAP